MPDTYPYDTLGPRPGENTGGPWLARKGLRKPQPSFLPIGGLLGSPVSTDAYADLLRMVRRQRFAILCDRDPYPTDENGNRVPGCADSLWPNVERPTVEVFKSRGVTHAYRDSFAPVPMLLTDVPGVYEHASDVDVVESRMSRARHERLYPELYAAPASTVTARGASTMSPGRELLRLPKPVSYPSDRTLPVTTTDRSRAARELWALERAADAILRAAGETWARLDVVSRDERLPIVAPDDAAYRGPVRIRTRKPCRYETETETVHLVTAFCGYGTENGWRKMLGLPCVPQTVTLYRTVILKRGVRYVGITSGYGRKERTGRAARVLEREQSVKARPADQTANRGKAVTVISAAGRSLARILGRADASVVAAANRIADVIGGSSVGHMLTLTDGSSVLIVNRRESTLRLSRESISSDGEQTSATVSGTHREIAQRVALAGLDLAD